MTSCESVTQEPPDGARTEPKTNWRSLLIAALLTFFSAIQLSIFFSALWPYLLQLDPSITESFFGWINAMYSLGQGIMCPLFGYLANKMGQSRFPTMIGLTMIIAGNITYLLCPLTSNSKWVMLIARAINGMGAGVAAVFRNYAVLASTTENRSRSISLNMGAFAVGVAIGPALQVLFTPFGYPGFKLFGQFQLDIVFIMMLGHITYLMCPLTPIPPQYMMLVSRIISGAGAGVTTVFRSYCVIASTSKDRSRALSMKLGSMSVGLASGPALQAIFTSLGYPGIRIIGSLYLNMYTASAFCCIFCNILSFVLLLMFFEESNVGLQDKPNIKSKENEEENAALPSYDKLAVAICIFTQFVLMFVLTNIETYVSQFWTSHRVGVVIGMCCHLMFHLLTFSWWNLPGKISYQEEYIYVNGTRILNPNPVGCSPSFEWCKYIPPVNMWISIISFIMFVGVGYSIINICMMTVFTRVLGPRKQGTMTGVVLLAGCIARTVGPLLFSSLFQNYGPRPVWTMEICFTGGCALLWILFYNRLVPLKEKQEYAMGETVKTKNGYVYKF